MTEYLHLCNCESDQDDEILYKPDKKKKLRRKKKINTRYNVNFGNNYPENFYGHKNCIKNAENVPSTMGWLWTASNTGLSDKVNNGWRPGAINKNMAKMMKMTSAQIHQQEREQQLRSFNTVKKTFCKINVHPNVKDMEKSIVDVDCAEEKVCVVINPPKDALLSKESKTNIGKNDAIILNITKKRQAKTYNDLNGPELHDAKTRPITHIVQKPVKKKKSPPIIDSEETWEIEYTPPLSWLKTKEKKSTTNTGTQYAFKECHLGTPSKTSLASKASFVNSLRSNSQIKLRSISEAKSKTIMRPKFSSDTKVLPTIKSRMTSRTSAS